jgi:hypothetical protein
MSNRYFDTITIIPLVASFEKLNNTKNIILQAQFWSKEALMQPPEPQIPKGSKYFSVPNRKDNVYSSDIHISPSNDHLTYTSPMVSNEIYAGVEKEWLCLFLEQISQQIYETTNVYEEKNALGAWQIIVEHALRVWLKVRRDLFLHDNKLLFNNNLLVDNLWIPKTIGYYHACLTKLKWTKGSPNIVEYFQRKLDKEQYFVYKEVKKYWDRYGQKEFIEGIDEVATMWVEIYERQNKESEGYFNEDILLYKN